MRKVFFALIAGLVITMTGCRDEGEYSPDYFWVGFGIVDVTDSTQYRIVMDDGDLLVPVVWDTYVSHEGQTFHDAEHHLNDGDRVLINYTILGDEKDDEGVVEYYYVRVNQIQSILMKGVMDITPEIEDSIGNDPVIVRDYWLTDSLLTFKLQYWGQHEIHFLNLVKQPGELNPEDQPIQLELRHNANDDEPSFLYNAYVSFSLNSLRIEGLDEVEFEVRAEDYSGEVFLETGVFNYAGLDLE